MADLSESPRAPARPPTALVTGATSGICARVAEELGRRGFEVIIVGRDVARTRAAVSRVAAVARVPPAEPIVADLSRSSEVRRAAAEVRSAHPRLSVLVNGAGAFFTRRVETPEGHERTWALNVVAPFLLTQELLPVLGADGGGARVVNLASAAHRRQRLDLDDPEGRARFHGWRAYGRSKLALILLTSAFARRFAPERVAFFSVHPGFVRSGFGKNNGTALAWGMRLAMLFAIPPESGARTVVFAATSPSLAGTSGRYLARSRVVSPSSAARDDAASERLWSLLERTTAAG